MSKPVFLSVDARVVNQNESDIADAGLVFLHKDWKNIHEDEQLGHWVAIQDRVGFNLFVTENNKYVAANFTVEDPISLQYWDLIVEKLKHIAGGEIVNKNFIDKTSEQIIDEDLLTEMDLKQPKKSYVH